jgi:hypothetical protein
VEGVLFEALAYIIYVRERYCSPLACAFTKAIANFEIKVDVQKGTLRFREN